MQAGGCIRRVVVVSLLILVRDCSPFLCIGSHRSGLPLVALSAQKNDKTDDLPEATSNIQKSLDPPQAALTLQKQAEALRAEADSLRASLEESRRQKLVKETTKVDKWIEELLIRYQVDENTQLLNDVEAVFERLQQDRYSQEQVDKIFNRICYLSKQSRSHCSPLMSLLVDAVGKLDCVERQDNPNKRWSGRVERKLRKRLFAMDWGMDLEEDDDEETNPWRINGSR
jgi:hypothetical protein